MNENHRSVARRGVDEFEVQKSRFIGVMDAVETEEDCRALIQECKRLYPQARHYCSAWVLGDGGLQKRADDDKEPQGTAGLPMLNVLERNGLTGVCCVAIRYFGGVLLGSGGLARAYAQTATIALSAAGMVDRVRAEELICRLDYAHWGVLQYRLETNEKEIVAIDYADRVRATFYVEPDERAFWENEIAALSSGTASVLFGESVWLEKPVRGEKNEKR